MIKVYPLASEVHGSKVYTRFLENFEKTLSRYNVVEFHSVITSLNDVSKADVANVKVAIMAFLTGGTSKLARALAYRLGARVPILMLAHRLHNSLPSALSAKNRLLLKGFKTHLSMLDLDSIEKTMTALKGLYDILSLKVLLLNEDSKPDEALEFEDKIGCEVIPIPKSEVKDEIERVDLGEVREIIRQRVPSNSLKHGVERLVEPVRLYVASRRLLKRYGGNALTIDCFPFIQTYKFTPCIAISFLNDDGIPASCEADFKSLLLLRLSYSITGLPGWMANLSRIEDCRLTLAHCTVALRLTVESKIMPHFETASPYAIGGKLLEGIYTLTALSYDYRRVAINKVKHVKSGVLEEGLCRTQAIVELYNDRTACNTLNLGNRVLSNHHVLMVGDVRECIAVAANMLGWKLTSYS